MSALTFPRQAEPALVRSFALAALVHIFLIGVMFLGVRWQSHRPDTVMVELWESAPPPPAPRVTAPPPPAPPKVEPVPRVEKPVIAIKEKAKPKPKAEPKPKPAAKPKPDPLFDKRLREQVALEQKALEQDRRERALQDLLARQQVDARAAWQDKIRAKIRGNIILPQGLSGNPEAIFDVTLLPSAEVLTVRKRKSSGNMAYDEAVERAILKSSPLPRPEQPSLFERQLELRFRPQDK